MFRVMNGEAGGWECCWRGEGLVVNDLPGNYSGRDARIPEIR